MAVIHWLLLNLSMYKGATLVQLSLFYIICEKNIIFAWSVLMLLHLFDSEIFSIYTYILKESISKTIFVKWTFIFTCLVLLVLVHLFPQYMCLNVKTSDANSIVVYIHIIVSARRLFNLLMHPCMRMIYVNCKSKPCHELNILHLWLVRIL